jgi:hypothetical protein
MARCPIWKALDLTFDQASKIQALDRVALTHDPLLTLGNVRLGVRGLHCLPPENCPSYWSIVAIEDSKSPKPPPSPIGEYDDVTVGAVLRCARQGGVSTSRPYEVIE